MLGRYEEISFHLYRYVIENLNHGKKSLQAQLVESIHLGWLCVGTHITQRQLYYDTGSSCQSFSLERGTITSVGFPRLSLPSMTECKKLETVRAFWKGTQPLWTQKLCPWFHKEHMEWRYYQQNPKHEINLKLTRNATKYIFMNISISFISVSHKFPVMLPGCVAFST